MVELFKIVKLRQNEQHLLNTVKKFEKVSEADLFEKEMQELEQYLKTNHYYDSRYD